MIQDNDKLKKVIDWVIKTYYGDRVHVYKSSFYDFEDDTDKFLVDNFPSVDFVPEIRSENLND